MTEMSTTPQSIEMQTESSTPLVCATGTSDSGDRTVKELVIHTWEITVSPKGDISDEFLAWFEKTYKDDNVFAVTEQDKGHKHLHALMQFSNGPRKLQNIRDSILRVVKKMHPGSVRASVYGTVCYSMKWYTDYSRKEESATQLTISNGFDPRKFELALPSEEDQKILQAAKGPRPKWRTATPHEREIMFTAQTKYQKDPNERVIIDIKRRLDDGEDSMDIAMEEKHFSIIMRHKRFFAEYQNYIKRHKACTLRYPDNHNK
tara:strand:- start:144 stop:926 length:783 start_codon:yes stop_codon:yes gene_type:complete